MIEQYRLKHMHPCKDVREKKISEFECIKHACKWMHLHENSYEQCVHWIPAGLYLHTYLFNRISQMPLLGQWVHKHCAPIGSHFCSEFI